MVTVARVETSFVRATDLRGRGAGACTGTDALIDVRGAALFGTAFDVGDFADGFSAPFGTGFATSFGRASFVTTARVTVVGRAVRATGAERVAGFGATVFPPRIVAEVGARETGDVPRPAASRAGDLGGVRRDAERVDGTSWGAESGREADRILPESPGVVNVHRNPLWNRRFRSNSMSRNLLPRLSRERSIALPPRRPPPYAPASRRSIDRAEGGARRATRRPDHPYHRGMPWIADETF